MKSLLVAVLLVVFSTGATACDVVPEGFTATGTAFRGTYANEAWGYSLEIPPGLAGYNPSAGPQHGFGIILGRRQGYILVNGEANSLEYEDPAEAAVAELRSLVEEKSRIVSARITPVNLGKLKASQLVVTYTCEGSAERYVLVATYALGPKKTPLYEIWLDSSEARHPDYRGVLDSMLKSWRYTGY